MKTISRYIMTLALLLTAVTGAWATEPKVINSEISYESLKVGDILVEGFSISGTYSSIFYFNAGRAKKGETLLNEDVRFYRGYISSVGTNAVITLSADARDAAGTYTPIDENGQVANAWIVTSMNGGGNNEFHLSGYKYVAPTTEPAIDVTPVTGKTNEWTFTMPAFDVEIAPIYAPVAQWAKVDNVDQLPTAIEGIYAGTENAIVNAGTVAKIGDTEKLQGEVMFFATTDAEMTAEKAAKADGWLATVPTAAGYDGAQTVYVWYYIKGADTPEGETASADNTFNDSEICATPITVTVLNNKFDINFKAANANTIEDGKATVKVGEADATVTDGKLVGVKMGSEVKIKAKPGYIIEKVKVKKAGTVPLDNTTTAWTAGTFAVPAGGLTYSDAITVSGDVTLVLTDGETLTLNKGISLASGATLTIQGNGAMVVNGTNESTASTVAGTGTLVLTSGTLTAKGGDGQGFSSFGTQRGGAAGGVAINGNVTIEGGTLTATGGNGGSISSRAGIHNGCGNGGAAISGALTINGGTVTTTDGSNGTAEGPNTAGSGSKAVAGTVTDNR